MSNPNNCAECDWMKAEHEGLHCYIFKDEPQDVCHQHTERRKAAFDFLMIAARFKKEPT